MKDNGRKLLKPNAIPTILHTGKVKVQELNLLLVTFNTALTRYTDFIIFLFQ